MSTLSVQNLISVQNVTVANITATSIITTNVSAINCNTSNLYVNSVAISPVTGAYKNKVINGNFDIWQRGTSNGMSGYYTADRWNCGNVGTTKVASRQSFTVGQTDVPGEPTYFMRHVVTSSAGASNYCHQQQKIESVRTLAGKTVTLSFYAKADASKNICTEFENYFGSGGSPSVGVNAIGVTTCALTSSWKKFTVTVTLPSISGKTLGSDDNDQLLFNFWFDGGSSFNSRNNSLGQQSGTFDIAQVQLEEGPVATAFEQRHIGQELALCQRYYEKSYRKGTNPGTASDTPGSVIYTCWVTSSYPQSPVVNFCVKKRAIPTVTVYSTSTGTAARIRDNNAAADRVALTSGVGDCAFNAYVDNVSITAINGLQFHWTADAEL